MRLTRPPRHDRGPVPGGYLSMHGPETGIIPLRDEIASKKNTKTHTAAGKEERKGKQRRTEEH